MSLRFRAHSYRGPWRVVDVRYVPEPIFSTPVTYWHHRNHWGAGRVRYVESHPYYYSRPVYRTEPRYERRGEWRGRDFDRGPAGPGPGDWNRGGHDRGGEPGPGRGGNWDRGPGKGKGWEKHGNPHGEGKGHGGKHDEGHGE